MVYLKTKVIKMTPVTQTKFYEAAKVRGNCLAACVASLLNLSIDQVPDFGNNGAHYSIEFLEFIEVNGLEYNGCPKYDPDIRYEGIDGYLIVNGKSPRGSDLRHSTIYKNGVLAHDPHPSNAGLLEIQDCFIIERRK